MSLEGRRGYRRWLSCGGGWWALAAGEVRAIARVRDWQREGYAGYAWFQSDHLGSESARTRGTGSYEGPHMNQTWGSICSRVIAHAVGLGLYW